MKDYLTILGAFLWGLLCALLGVSCEWAGQAALGIGHGLMHAADRLQEYAFRVGVWD